MKKLVLGAAFALAANAAMAGSIAGPVITPDVVVQQASSSSMSDHILAPLTFVVMVGTAFFLM